MNPSVTSSYCASTAACSVTVTAKRCLPPCLNQDYDLDNMLWIPSHVNNNMEEGQVLILALGPTVKESPVVCGKQTIKFAVKK